MNSSIHTVLCLERIKGFLMIHSNTQPIICLSRGLQLAWHQPDLGQIREKVVLWKLKFSTHKPVGRLCVPLFCRGVCFRNFGDKTQTHSITSYNKLDLKSTSLLRTLENHFSFCYWCFGHIGGKMDLYFTLCFLQLICFLWLHYCWYTQKQVALKSFHLVIKRASNHNSFDLIMSKAPRQTAKYDARAALY